MKNIKYKCVKCETIMTFQRRDVGQLPKVIGCKKSECEGLSTEIPNAIVRDLYPIIDGVFFSPKTNVEWDAIKSQLKFEAQKKYSKKKIHQINKIVKDVIFSFKNHVDNGGLIFLPMSYFSKIEKQSVD